MSVSRIDRLHLGKGPWFSYPEACFTLPSFHAESASEEPECIGGPLPLSGAFTPMIETTLRGFPLRLKLEEFTPSGSHKDRPTRFLAQSLRLSSKFRAVGGRRPLFLVPSSGNFGLGFAHNTKDDAIDIVIFTDILSSAESRDAPRAYGHVQVEVVNQRDQNGSYMKARMALIQEYLRQYPHATVVDQYADPRIPLAYELTLAREIDEQTDGKAGIIFVPVGTGGLLNGILKYAVKHRRPWTVVAADAFGSRLFWDPAGVKRRFPGYGNGQPTGLIQEVSRPPYAYHVAHIEDVHAAWACHRLLKQQSLMFGPSGGAVIAAVELVLHNHRDLIPDSGHAVAIIPDSGRKYRSTLYCENWLIANGLGKVVGWAI